MKKTYYTIPKLNIAVLSAAGLMLLSAILRIIYYTGVRAAPGELWVQGVLPVCACLLFAVMIFTTASDRLYRTTVPVLMGCVFFAVKAGRLLAGTPGPVLAFVHRRGGAVLLYCPPGAVQVDLRDPHRLRSGLPCHH